MWSFWKLVLLVEGPVSFCCNSQFSGVKFQRRCQIKIQQLFADALAPMLTRLKNMQEEQGSKVEHVDFKPQDPAESRWQLVCFHSEDLNFVAKFRQEHEKKLEVIRQEMETINEVLALRKYTALTGFITCWPCFAMGYGRFGIGT